MLDSVLEFTQVETGRVPILEKKFHLKALIDRLMALEKPAAVAKDLPVKMDIDSNIPAVLLGDPFRLQRILINLLSNAIKFTQKGHVNVSAKLA